MSSPIIVLGDKTSHGGTVITASLITTTEGKGWARLGDMVSCPRCKGVFPISQADPSLIAEGQAVAYHGCKVACGATLISSQMLTWTTPSRGEAPGESSEHAGAAIADGYGHIAAGLLSTYQDEPLAAGAHFRGRFRVIDAATGEPVSSQAVRVRSTDGQYLTGATDADGFTQWVERDANEALAFDLVQDGGT